MNACDLLRQQGITARLEDLENLDFTQNFAASNFWYPLAESLHVVAVAFLVGAMIFLDLRLIGFYRSQNPVRGASRVLPLAWAGFVVAVVTGCLLFAPQASRYVCNPAFQTKFALMLAAGINMLVFHFGIWKSVGRWNDGEPTPIAAKASGVLSALFWIGVVYYGRLVPFLA